MKIATGYFQTSLRQGNSDAAADMTVLFDDSESFATAGRSLRRRSDHA